MIALACDHGGYVLKEEIMKYLDEQGIAYKDFGCNGETVDYPDIVEPAARAIVAGECDKGIFAAAPASVFLWLPIRYRVFARPAAPTASAPDLQGCTTTPTLCAWADVW